MSTFQRGAPGRRGRFLVRRTALVAVVLAAFFVVVSAALAGAESSADAHLIVGPAGYMHGNDELIVAGTSTPTLGAGDQVVICHALGMQNKGTYVQNAPSAGVVFGHAGSDHQNGEDIIPPFVYSDHQGTNTTLQHGQNWDAAGQAIYTNGCVAPAPQVGTLTVIKQVVGGSATPGQFTLHLDATGASFAGSSVGTVITNVPVGPYAVTELAGGPEHYTASFSGGCSGSMTAGASPTCTVTNTYHAPQPTTGTLTVIKQVVGGSATPGQFTLYLDGPGSSVDHSFAGSATGTTIAGVPLGAYSVSEFPIGPPSYTASFSGGCSGSMTAGASPTCTVTNTYHAPSVDLKVTKTDLPDPVPVGALLKYIAVVANATTAAAASDVTLTDPLPAGVAFVSASASQGTCTFGSGSVVCKLGALQPGAAAAVEIHVRPRSPGKLTNTAVAVAAEPELTPADNSAVASTIVKGPFTPPALLCAGLRVTPIALHVGQAQTIVVRVKDQRGRPFAGATVTLRGPAISVRGRTSSAGVYRRLLQPKRAGVLVVRALPHAAGKCLGRVGVVGIFQPPVTG